MKVQNLVLTSILPNYFNSFLEDRGHCGYITEILTKIAISIKIISKIPFSLKLDNSYAPNFKSNLKTLIQ